MRHAALVTLALLAATVGCARTPQVAAPPPPPARDEMIVLLPGADGKTGALTVTHENQQRTLDAPYATARLQQQGKLEDGGRLTAEQVQQMTEEELLAFQGARDPSVLGVALDRPRARHLRSHGGRPRVRRRACFGHRHRLRARTLADRARAT